MTHLLKLITVFFFIFSVATAQIVQTFNTPIGPITQGVNVVLTWSFVDGVEPKTVTTNGTLNAVDSKTKNTVVISDQVPLAPGNYNWLVELDPSTYNLGLNDGTGFKQTADVEIIAKGGKTPPPPPAEPTTPQPTSPSTPDEPTSPGTPSKPAENTPVPSPISGSASSIFSGYGVVFSLLAVAITMVQF